MMNSKTGVMALSLGIASCLVFILIYFESSPLSLSASTYDYLKSWNVAFVNDTSENEKDGSSVNDLKRQIKILIWVMTSPQNLNTKARAVKETWASHAKTVLFMSSITNSSFPAIGLNVSEGRENLTNKTMKAFTYIYHQYFNEYDWFMKVDDDTYVIVENLLYFLSDKNKSEPIYYGNLFKVLLKQGFHSGGAGYVLSKEALRRLCEKGNAERCIQKFKPEDVAIGACLENLGVKTGQTVDKFGKTMFHGHMLETLFVTTNNRAYNDYDIYNGTRRGVKWLSDYAVTFHYVTPIRMFELEYFIYKLRPYGVSNKT